MPREITIRHIRHLEEFEALHEAWEKLTNRREVMTVFLTWEWLFVWWKTHHEGKDLWLITAWQEDELVGIAPLMLSKEKKYLFRFRLLQSLGAPNTDESDFLSVNDDQEVLSALLEYILQSKKQWDAVTLHELRSSRVSTSTLRDAFSGVNLIIRIETNYHYYIPISEAWDVYFKSLSKNFRQNLERRLRRTKEANVLSFDHYKVQHINWDHFESMFKINKYGTFPEKYESETERSFHRELFEIMRQKNWVEVAFVSLDGEPVAFEYGFNLNGRFEDWRTGYNKNFSKQAVGKLLLYLFLQELFKLGYSGFDFLRGEYEHKQDWQPLKNEFITITTIRPTHLPSWLALSIIPSLWRWTKKHLHIMDKNSLF